MNHSTSHTDCWICLNKQANAGIIKRSIHNRLMHSQTNSSSVEETFRSTTHLIGLTMKKPEDHSECGMQ